MPDDGGAGSGLPGTRPLGLRKSAATRQLAQGVRKKPFMVRYSQAFKEKMVQKMAGPNGRSPTALAGEVGVSESSLYRWLDQMGTVPAVAKKKTTGKKRSRASSKAKRPQDWTPAQKLEAVMEVAALSDDELGEFLRRKGLHEAQLEQWREQLQAAAPEVFGKRRRGNKKSPEQKRIRELEKELRRKEKALAETAALLVLKKKVQAIWGDEDDDTDPRSDG